MSREKLSMSEFRKRKTRLQDDLELLEGSFENRFNKAKKSILGSFNPAQTIRKRPFQAVALSVAAGIVIGLSGKKKRRGDTAKGASSSESPGGSVGFTSLLLDEVKRIAARRAASYISEVLDQKLSDK